MNLLFLTFLFPLIGFLLLAFARGRLSENVSALIGVGSMALSAASAAWVGYDFLHTVPAGGAYTQVLWTWISVDGFSPQFALYLDGLALTMMGVITGVGFLIHVFASWYMRGDDGYTRFFSYMNLFVAAMLFLVLGDNLLFLYLGWEGVGSGQRSGGAQGVHRHPRRRHLHGHRPADPVPRTRHPEYPGPDDAGAAALRRRRSVADRRHPAAGRWRGRQVRAAAAADLARRRHGRPDPGVRADPRRHHGHRRRLPDRAHPRPVPADPGRAAAGRRHRRGDAGAVGLRRAGADRHQAHPGLLDHEPDRLHVPGAGRRGLVGGDLPPHDPRLLQGPAVPLGGRGDHRLPPRAGHLQDGRPAQEDPVRVRLLPGRRRRAGRAAAGDLGLLLQGRDPVRGLGRRSRLPADRGPGRRLPDLGLHLPPDLHCLPRQGERARRADQGCRLLAAAGRAAGAVDRGRRAGAPAARRRAAGHAVDAAERRGRA
ncbi:UNVERIFIED_CONTAM: nuoL [Trichonephila clavipes]